MSYSTASFAVPALDRTSVDPEIAVGTVVKGTDNSEFVYVQAAEALTQYDAVAVDAGQASQLTATNAITGVEIGAAQVAFAINEYGFVQTRGAFDGVNVLASAATDVQLYATSTAGSLDDAGTVTLAGISLTETDGGAGGPVTAHAGAGITAF